MALRPQAYGPFTSESRTYATSPSSARAVAAMQAASVRRPSPPARRGVISGIAHAIERPVNWAVGYDPFKRSGTSLDYPPGYYGRGKPSPIATSLARGGRR